MVLPSKGLQKALAVVAASQCANDVITFIEHIASDTGGVEAPTAMLAAGVTLKDSSLSVSVCCIVLEA